MEFVLKTRRIWWIIPLITVCAVHNSIPSPNGDKSLVIFGKECGATVEFNTQASIAPASLIHPLIF